MAATTLKSPWTISGAFDFFSDAATITPPSSNPTVVFVLHVREVAGTGTTWQVVLQRFEDEVWVDHATLITTGSVEPGVYYVSQASIPSTQIRLRVQLDGTSPAMSLDAFACDAALLDPWVHEGHLAHRIDALGGPFASQIESLLVPEVERGLSMLLDIRDTATTDHLNLRICHPFKAHHHPCDFHHPAPTCPLDDGGTSCNVFDVHYDRAQVPFAASSCDPATVTGDTFKLLATRIEHYSLSSTVVAEVAADAGMTESELRAAIDNLNAVADAALRVYDDLA